MTRVFLQCRAGRCAAAGRIAITPDGKFAYVACQESNTVTPIRTATNTRLRAIKAGAHPIGMVLAP